MHCFIVLYVNLVRKIYNVIVHWLVYDKYMVGFKFATLLYVILQSIIKVNHAHPNSVTIVILFTFSAALNNDATINLRVVKETYVLEKKFFTRKHRLKIKLPEIYIDY